MEKKQRRWFIENEADMIAAAMNCYKCTIAQSQHRGGYLGLFLDKGYLDSKALRTMADILKEDGCICDMHAKESGGNESYADIQLESMIFWGFVKNSK